MADQTRVEEPAPATKPGGEQLPHQPALDGLRGAAVAGVLLFHGGYLQGGYLGVDAFFVLSGFLITSLLLQEANRGHGIGLRAFWARRARRLLPALAAVILVVAVYAGFVAQPVQLDGIRADGFATIFYVANWRSVFHGSDYFALFQDPSPFQHTWSLAIEEQFYLVWPLVVLGLTRSSDRSRNLRRVLAFAIGAAVVSFALMQLLYNKLDPARVYYGTDTRAASVAIGAALAALLMLRGPVGSARARRGLEAAGLVSAAGLVMAWTQLEGSNAFLYRGGLLLSAIAVAVVIAASTHPEPGLLRRGLSWRPLCALGLISYGAYLWHWPIYVYLDERRVGVGGLWLLAIRLAVTLAIACASFVWLERPIRKGVPGTHILKRVAPAVAVLVVLALVVSTQGAEARPAYMDNAVPVQGEPFWDRLVAEYRTQAAGAETSTRAMALGDSIAGSLGSNRSAVAGKPVAGASLGLIECSIVTGSYVSAGVERQQDPKCAAWEQLYADAVAAYRPDTVFLMLGPWELFDRKRNGHVLRAGSPALADELFASLERARAAVTANGARLVLVATPCYRPDDVAFPGSRGVWRDRERIDWLNGVWRVYAAQHRDDVAVVELDGVGCDDTGAAARRTDGVHFTPAGATFVWQQLAGEAVRAR